MRDKNNKILVTGSAGFIGFHICKLLLSKDFFVLGVDGFTDYYDVTLKLSRNKILKTFKNFTNYECMLEDEESLFKICSKEQIKLHGS